MKDKRFDAAIIGGGASGLAAAIELGMRSPGLNIVILEKNAEPARKIRATGNGRCNITNTAAEGYDEIMEFFSRIGIVTRAYENGLVYPYSESAADVAGLLISRAKETGTQILTGAEVTELEKDGSGRFIIRYQVKGTEGKNKGRPLTQTVTADNVILAAGGKAGPAYGTTGDGYRLAHEMGHSIVTPVPVLTSVECAEWNDKVDPCAAVLAGTRTRGIVRLSGRGTELFREEGEIQFTRTGISGICVFNMTRYMRYDRSAGESLGDFAISVDLYPDGSVESILRQRRDNAFPGESAGDILRTVLKQNIAGYILATAEKTYSERLRTAAAPDLTDSEISHIAACVHNCHFRPEALRGWKEAQATSGGVSLMEIDSITCESALVSGLYITGELADRDFPCGGFNLSNAWATGIHAADDIAGKYTK